MEKMEDDQLMKRIVGPNMRGRPQMGWMDGVKRGLDERSKWRVVVNA